MRVIDDDKPAEVIDGTPTTVSPRTPWFRRRGTLVGIALALTALIAALVFTNGRAVQKAVDASVSRFSTFTELVIFPFTYSSTCVSVPNAGLKALILA
jgi:hypothetical protein